MKVFLIIEAYSDDDGNVGSLVHSTHKTRDEALAELKVYHDDVVSRFSDPDDTYEDGDSWFDISEADDIAIRNVVQITELDIQ